MNNISLFPPPEFFPGIRLNFAENLLAGRDSNTIAVHTCTEGGENLHDVAWGELRSLVEQVADAMMSSGIKTGDRVAGVVSNRLETMVICLASLSIGALWSTSSPDMGVQGILDRLLQIRPRLVFGENAVMYNAKLRDLMAKNRQCAKRMTETPEYHNFIVISRGGDPPAQEVPGLKIISWGRFLSRGMGRKLSFKPLPFSHPGFIVYSSGTVCVYRPSDSPWLLTRILV